jgi:hypothetical protein
MYEKMAATKKIPENDAADTKAADTKAPKPDTTDMDADDELEEIALDKNSIVDLDEEDRKAAEAAREKARQAVFDEDWARIESERMA